MMLEQEILRFLEDPSGFESLALKIYQFQRTCNPAFRSYCEYLGTPEKLDSWKQIPGIPQQAFKRSELRSFPAEKTTTQFRTSGTTGEGYGSHFFPSLRLYEASVQRTWSYFEIPRHPFLLLMQHPDDAPYSSLSRMGGILTGNNKESFFVNRKGELMIDALKEAVAGLNRVTLFGTALAFLNLIELDARLKLPEGSVAIETGGFKGSGRTIEKNDLYNRFHGCFDLPTDSIWNEYGMTELSSQFYSYGVGRPHLAPPWLRYLIIDPASNLEAAPGQVGMLRIIDLTNLWSVIGIQTQDLAKSSPDGGFFLLGRDPSALPRGCSRAMDEMLNVDPLRS